MFAHKHLLSIDDLSPEDIMTILKQARTFEEINERPIKKFLHSAGKRYATCFLSPPHVREARLSWLKSACLAIL